MRNLIAAASVAITLGASPVLAQTTPTGPAGVARSQADCQADFKSADTNNDGQLARSEMDASKTNMPTSLSSSATVTQQAFMSACSVNVQGPQK